MQLLMYKLHPDSKVRASAGGFLQPRMGKLEQALRAVLKKACQQNRIDADAGTLDVDFPEIGRVVDTSWVDSTSEPNGEDIDSFNRRMDKVDTDTMLTLFGLVAAKRMFCGAPRFSNGGDPSNADQFGLALLNREYAYIAVMPTDEERRAFDPRGINDPHILL
eukprot:3939011-Rhodomonas_salina.1